MYTQFSLSPDGKYVLRETLREPFSELVGYNQFARAQEVIDLDGKVLAEISKTPLRESSQLRRARRRQRSPARDRVASGRQGPVDDLARAASRAQARRRGEQRYRQRDWQCDRRRDSQD